MDRFDERKPDSVAIDDVSEQPRQGDILGLSGSEVPKAPDDPSTEYDAESIAKRRDRAGDVLGLAHESEDLTSSAGATSIDMGRGGTGTDISED